MRLLSCHRLRKMLLAAVEALAAPPTRAPGAHGHVGDDTLLAAVEEGAAKRAISA